MNTTIIIKSDPREGKGVSEGLRIIAAMLGMDHVPLIVFLDEGIGCLRPEALDERSRDFLKTAADLAGIYVFSESLKRFALKADDIDANLRVTLVDMDKLAEMMLESDIIAAF